MGKIFIVTGGIGAGKSVVCRILRAQGIPVYDCDAEARQLMDTSLPLRRAIEAALAPYAKGSVLKPDTSLDRPAIAATVFSCSEALAALNTAVHPAVLDHLRRWAAGFDSVVFAETAIPASSGLRSLASGEWIVTAPMALRVARAMARDNATEPQVLARIEAQRSEWERPVPGAVEIVNDECQSLLLQITASLHGL